MLGRLIKDCFCAKHMDQLRTEFEGLAFWVTSTVTQIQAPFFGHITTLWLHRSLCWLHKRKGNVYKFSMVPWKIGTSVLAFASVMSLAHGSKIHVVISVGRLFFLSFFISSRMHPRRFWKLYRPWLASVHSQSHNIRVVCFGISAVTYFHKFCVVTQ